MIDQNSQYNQLPKELNSVFSELKINKHLRHAGIKKSFGFGCTYLFQLIFCLIFQHKNWFSLLDSKKAEKYPAKDAVYRFLNQSTFNWRRFLLLLSSFTIHKVDVLTDKSRPKVLIVDDSSYDRNRSKKVELLARCFDHASLKMRFYKGFRMLTLGWSDGHTFMPIDFSLLSSKNAQINGISKQIDKRTCGYQRRKDALLSAPEQIPAMIKRALASGINADYVLMDSWFTLPPLVKAIVEQGLGVIGMVKETKQRYNVNGKLVSLKQLYCLAVPVQSKKGILRSIHTTMSNGTPIKVVFIQNRNKKSEWLAILSTDCTLSEQEIVRIYGMRWDIEVFFKTTKSLLKLQKEFQSRSYDGLISHTTIVFVRFIVLSWQNRCNTDQRTIGGLFYELCDEVNELDWAVALQQLIEFLQDALEHTNKKIKKLIQSQLEQWISGLPSYIKAYLPISLCES
ncbi:IS4 family transposase [Schinkia azotoformans]|uniref:IS4 family transposase n=1 Tax=Schinkia azotoformans TaxID=1454 RepID=UPI002DBFDFC2|nr:transposase [Schinkia azotoformans]MEC1723104.1 transposase [Schinkia azotoformans]MED4411543.1 transposase [Schinkia azotoformans]